jgi:predicted nucleotidyltransferase
MKDQDNDSEKPKKFRKRKINQVIENKVSTQGDLININEPIILKIADLAEQNGYEIYIVGGYVRDSLLSRERKDFDFSVVGDSIEFAKKRLFGK